MIQLVDIRRLVDRLTKKEQRGNVISGEDFNTFLRIAQAEHFEVVKKKAEETGDVSDRLRSFISTTTGTTSSALLSIPANYSKLLSAQRLYNASFVRCDLVSQMELEERQSNSLTAPSAKYPVVSVDSSSNFRFSPSTNASVKVIYLKNPTDPILDYYIDTEDRTQYLEESEVHTWTTGETDSAGTSHTTGQPNYTSLTTELEWEDDFDRVAIAYRLLTKIGVTIPNNLAVELGATETMKNDTRQ